jgi:hypothetical protein
VNLNGECYLGEFRNGIKEGTEECDAWKDNGKYKW